MDISEFLRDLHFDTDKAKPPDLEPDWEDAPLPYKLYRNLPYFPFTADVPLTLIGRPERGYAESRSFGHFLWYAYGTSQSSRTAIPPEWETEGLGSLASYRRVVPSGGGLYPNEIYAYLKLADLPEGIYHYDAGRHRLVMLREGEFDAYLEQALGGRWTAADHFGALFVSTVYWKNSFKYHDFSYRLQGLDAGVLIGQLLEVGTRFGYTASVYYQYLDRAVNHLLGLQEKEESVYAVIPLSDHSIEHPGPNEENAAMADRPSITAESLIRQLPALQREHYVKSRNVKEYPRVLRMNEASLQHATGAFRGGGNPPAAQAGGQPLPLPRSDPTPYDLAVLSRSRYSPETDFVLKPVGKRQLSEILRQTWISFAYRNDLDRPGERETRVGLCGCFHGVEGIPDGAYRYDGASHSLVPLREGDHRAWLQYGLTFPNVNLSQTPLIFHVTGDRRHGQPEWGPRGYRIQQMEAGKLVQNLLLALSSAGMAGRPLLGYEAELSDDLYRLPAAGQTALVQIPAGPYRYRSRYEGSLHG
ncbi:SagB family peptide dehydrogenase [Cohnella candidum]|nr:SagB family peptide dehydrogenase [Cohnella candidum]